VSRRGHRPLRRATRRWPGAGPARASRAVVSPAASGKPTSASSSCSVTAYKLKKPVRTAFCDFSTAELRRAALDRELVLNRSLASDVYLATGEIIEPGPDGGPTGEPTEEAGVAVAHQLLAQGRATDRSAGLQRHDRLRRPPDAAHARRPGPRGRVPDRLRRHRARRPVVGRPDQREAGRRTAGGHRDPAGPRQSGRQRLVGRGSAGGGAAADRPRHDGNVATAEPAPAVARPVPCGSDSVSARSAAPPSPRPQPPRYR
ncbi:MAG: uncharacterized protein V7633_4966, partial [Pseudonocardia sp.]